MTGAIEFLTKAKAICESRENYCYSDNETERCPVFSFCHGNLMRLDPADLVRKVMGYEIKEDGDNEESNN